ncbi:uncharacterized protein LOC127103684 [Lathyrus oleraceus]|uniref:uncharacterized protein LOC127103684 n=1 Tax=Pisum sativum TaxID=3888 RepID=UPI0021CEE1FC|nr:uncharacterized protein LOC127103684 [Pisum sativum]
MVTLFHDMIRKEIKVYADDMIAKSQNEEDHLNHLKKLFERFRKFRLRLNPAKCTFGVRSGKLLGFIVSQRGIEVDRDKVRAIQEMHAPRAEREVRGFLGRLNYISSRYSLLEKTCYALAWAAGHLRQYMICHTTLLISKMDPIKYIFDKPALIGRLSRWQMLLSEYHIQYVTQKAIKGSVLAEYLAHQPVEDYQPLKFDFLDEDIMVIKDCEIPGPDEGPEPGSRWKLAFDGSSNYSGHGVGAVLMNPNGGFTPFITRLCFDFTNNVAEHEACILGIEATIDLRIKILEVYGDLALVIYQVKGEWVTCDANLIPYRAHVVKLIEYFDDITFYHIPRVENQVADALATLTSMYQVKFRNEAPVYRIERRDEHAYCQSIKEETDGKPWFHDIKRYLQSQEYSEDATLLDKKMLRRLSSKFFFSNDVMYEPVVEIFLKYLSY